MHEIDFNVIDLPWVPIRNELGEVQIVTLRAALKDAANLEGLATTSPVETVSLLRFLISISALVAREYWGEDVPRRIRNANEIEITRWSQSVDDVLAKYEDLFYLKHPNEPFLQEWRPSEAQSAKVTIGKMRSTNALRLEIPSPTTKRWWVRNTARQVDGEVSDIIIPLLTHWFTSFGSNKPPLNAELGNAYHGGRGLTNGKDVQVFVHGASLLETLLANLPRSWVTEQAIPVFLARREPVTRDSIGKTSEFWLSTYGPNGVLLAWEGGDVIGVYNGLSRYGINGIRRGKLTQDEKDELKILFTHDPFRIELPDGSGMVTRISPEGVLLPRLRNWYAEAGHLSLRKELANRILVVNNKSKIDIYTSYVKAGQDFKVDYLQLIEDSPLYLLDLSEQNVDQIDGAVEVALGKFGKSGGIIGALKTSLRKLDVGTEQVEPQFWQSCSNSVNNFIELLISDHKVNQVDLAKAFRYSALHLFDEYTRPYRTVSMIPKIENSRKILVTNINKLMPKELED